MQGRRAPGHASLLAPGHDLLSRSVGYGTPADFILDKGIDEIYTVNARSPSAAEVGSAGDRVILGARDHRENVQFSRDIYDNKACWPLDRKSPKM
jgi:hypothetical protein